MAPLGHARVTPPLYLLDTNVLLAVARGKELYARIEAEFGLSVLRYPPLVSLVSVAEVSVLAEMNAWGERQHEAFQALVRGLVVVPVGEGDGGDLLDAYVAIDVFSRRQKPGAITMGKNDLWIAATAHVTRATLLTTDRDFDHLDDVFLNRIWVDPVTPL